MLKKFDCFGLDRNLNFMDLLYQMLDFNPMRRISPNDILNHPFIVNSS
jgi:serine/threonine protein kinase